MPYLAVFQGSGAVYCGPDSSDREMVIEGSTFQGNTAEASASAVSSFDRSLTIRNTQFIENEGTPVLFESESATGAHQLEVRLQYV